MVTLPNLFTFIERMIHDHSDDLSRVGSKLNDECRIYGWVFPKTQPTVAVKVIGRDNLVVVQHSHQLN